MNPQYFNQTHLLNGQSRSLRVNNSDDIEILDVTVYFSLSCDSMVSENQALISFKGDFEDAYFTSLGLTFSSRVGWYKYIKTRPGDVNGFFNILLPPSGELEMVLDCWLSTGDVILNYFFVLRNKPLVDLSLVRDVSRYESYTWNSLADFIESDDLSSGCHSIGVEGLYFDFIYSRLDGCPLLCHLHGNAPRSPDYKLPAFNGWNITSGLNCSILLFSDPLLYMDPQLELSWHSGCESFSVQLIYELIIKKLNSVSKFKDFIFFGGSGGGYASLYLASKFKHSTAFVWNPQTSILSYEPDSVDKFFNTCFGLYSQHELINCNGRLIIDLFAGVDLTGVKILYLQNITDWHVQCHLLPFLHAHGLQVDSEEFSGWLSPTFYLHLKEMSSGHEPPPSVIIRGILEVLTSSSDSFFHADAFFIAD